MLPCDLPCGGCTYCHHHCEEWSDLCESADDVAPLNGVCRQVQTCKQEKAKKKSFVIESEESLWTINISQFNNEMLNSRTMICMSFISSWMLSNSLPDMLPTMSPTMGSYWLNCAAICRINGVVYLMWMYGKGMHPHPAMRSFCQSCEKWSFKLAIFKRRELIVHRNITPVPSFQLWPLHLPPNHSEATWCVSDTIIMRIYTRCGITNKACSGWTNTSRCWHRVCRWRTFHNIFSW